MTIKVQHITDIVQNAFNERARLIPLHEPRFRGNEKKYVADTIDSTFVSSVGAYVNQAEQRMTEITNTKLGIAVVNGTAGIQVALRLVGVRAGDEVITQALTFIATANAIQYNGCTPIFIDVDRDTMGLSPDSLKIFLSEFGELRDDGCYNRKTNKRIAACLPMHTFGFPVRLSEMVDICNKWQIPLVEDAAESLGSYYNGIHVGNFGKAAVFSFNGNKIVTCGGGGMIVTNDNHLGTIAKHLTTTAKVPHPYEYIHDEVGYNYRLPNLNAALLLAQLEQLDSFLASKRELANFYNEYFSKNGIQFRMEMPNTRANYWLMCIEAENRAERDLLLKETNSNKVMTRPIWQLLFRSKMFEHCQRDGQENAIFLEDRIINIPSSVR